MILVSTLFWTNMKNKKLFKTLNYNIKIYFFNTYKKNINRMAPREQFRFYYILSEFHFLFYFIIYDSPWFISWFHVIVP